MKSGYKKSAVLLAVFGCLLFAGCGNDFEGFYKFENIKCPDGSTSEGTIYINPDYTKHPEADAKRMACENKTAS